MEIPKNCRECKHYEKCHAPHYGGSGCQYEKAIIEAIISGNLKL